MNSQNDAPGDKMKGSGRVHPAVNRQVNEVTRENRGIDIALLGSDDDD